MRTMIVHCAMVAMELMEQALDGAEALEDALGPKPNLANCPAESLNLAKLVVEMAEAVLEAVDDVEVEVGKIREYYEEMVNWAGDVIRVGSRSSGRRSP